MIKYITLIAVYCFAVLTTSYAQEQEADVNAQYVFFFHSKILEDMGEEAISSQYGTYEYDSIVMAFEHMDYITFAEIRPKHADPEHYAMKTIAQMDSLKRLGVPSSHINVVGTSKGALISMLISTLYTDTAVKYVVMGMCNDATARYFNLNLHGKVLSIYEDTDVVGKSCINIKQQSKQLTAYREEKLELGIGHGFVFRPMDEWLVPTFEWIEQH